MCDGYDVAQRPEPSPRVAPAQAPRLLHRMFWAFKFLLIPFNAIASKCLDAFAEAWARSQDTPVRIP